MEFDSPAMMCSCITSSISEFDTSYWIKSNAVGKESVICGNALLKDRLPVIAGEPRPLGETAARLEMTKATSPSPVADRKEHWSDVKDQLGIHIMGRPIYGAVEDPDRIRDVNYHSLGWGIAIVKGDRTRAHLVI
jgi:hypothetical protein